MGALEIRQSSANLNGLGQFRMPELDNGSSRAWEAHANAAKQAAEAARVAGMAEVSGISRRGQIVSETLRGLGKLAFEFADRENERIANEAVLELKRRTVEEMYGDGKEKIGRLNENIKDVGSWVQSIREWDGKTIESLEKDMSGAQRKLFRQRIADQQISLQSTVAQHAAKTTLKKQETEATATAKGALDEAAASFHNPLLREQKIEKYVEAVQRKMDILNVPEAARGVMMRSAMFDLLSKGLETSVDVWSAEVASNPATAEDPIAIRKVFEAKRDELEKVGYMLKQKDIAACIPEGLEDAEKAMFRSRIEEAGVKAEHRAESLRASNMKLVNEGFDKQEAEFSKNGDPATWSDTYRAWSKDEALKKYNPERAAEYGRKADRLLRLERLRQEGQIATDPAYWKYERDPKKLKESLDGQLAEIIRMRISDADPREVQRKQEQFFYTLREETIIGDLDEKGALDLTEAANTELDAQSVQAVKDLWNELGMPIEYVNEKTGWLTKEAEGGKIPVPDSMNGEAFGRVFTWSDAVGMTKVLMNELKTNPKAINDRAAVKNLVQAIKLTGLSDKKGDELNTYALDLMKQVEQEMMAGVSYSASEQERGAREEIIRQGDEWQIPLDTGAAEVTDFGIGSLISQPMERELSAPVSSEFADTYRRAVMSKRAEEGREGYAKRQEEEAKAKKPTLTDISPYMFIGQ